MADIAQDLQRIEDARYGEEVRGSIHDAIYDINQEAVAAKEAAETAQDSAINSANKAQAEATKSESYAVGGTGSRTGEDTDNAKYYYERVEAIAENYEVVDNLGSVSTTNALSANQGRVLNEKISTINGKVGNANGIASLDATGRVPYSQLPESAMEYKGTWNANTNTPTLVSGEGTNGDFYVVSVAGTWNGEDWNVGDRALFDDITAHDWVRLAAGEVNSVNGQVGYVQLNAGDIPFDNTDNEFVADDVQGAIEECMDNAGVQIIEKTYAEYLADKSELDASGDLIKITDSGVSNSAIGVSYDPTGTDLESTNAQGAITELDGKLSADGYSTTGLSYTNCGYEAGGYYKIGSTVVVVIRVQANSTSMSIDGFPTYNGSSVVVPVSVMRLDTPSNPNVFARVNSSGNLSVQGVSNNGVYALSCVYLQY